MPTILVLKVLRFFGGGWKPIVVYGWKPSLDDDTESIDSGLSGVSDCKPVCLVGCNPVGLAGADESSKHSLNCSMAVGCNPVVVAGADELSKRYNAFKGVNVTNANYGWTKLRCEIRLQW